MIGQKRVLEQLDTIIKGSKINETQLPSFIFCGPRGYGKTTIARLIAKDLGYKLIEVIGGNITKPHHLALPIFINAPKQDKKSGNWDKKGLVIFIDEMHSADNCALEILYPVIQESMLNLIIGSATKPQVVNVPLHNVIVIGATTNEELLPKPLVQRMVSITLDQYTNTEMGEIVCGESKDLTAYQIGKLIPYLRGTPRNAVQYTRRCAEYLAVHERLDVVEVMTMQGVDENYLTDKEVKYLKILHFMGGGPVGLASIASVLDLPKDQVSENIETYLVQQGFVYRTPQGRTLSESGRVIAVEYGESGEGE